MNVWLRKTRRETTCKADTCQLGNRAIRLGDIQVVTSWVLVTPSGQRWYKSKVYHPECWLSQGIAAVEARQVVETRGRKRMTITDPNRTMRLSIMRRRASVVQRLNAEMSQQSPNYDKVGRMTDILEKLKVEIEPFGGIPSSWLSPDEGEVNE